ncbi:sugar ABC transporter substrate-binding protein [Paenibacillus vini]|uniref:Cyclodextrin-binding protein n=1 Tax=Paenibacillus vini TaxID=1476024 RepID=A0ABQ4M9U7_9BACL|nr:maltose ABC transporter substrate-binding protein [Paenibacillus vini]GIP52761.1 cyclodextrin-binding protein [Paenibacillus vini]
MKFKRTLVLLATLSLAASITACGGNGNKTNNAANTPAPSNTAAENQNTGSNEATTEEIKPEDGAELLIWESREEIAFTEQIAQKFEEKYGVKVRVEEVPVPDQIGRLTTDGPSGLGADIIVIPSDHIGNAVTTGLILENDVFGEETKSRNTEASIVGASYDGKLYGYPRAAETTALYYNKSLIPEAPKTFEELIEFGKTFTDKTKKKYALMWESGNLYFNYPFIASNGGYLFGDNGTNKDDIGLATPEALAGMKVFQDLKQILPVPSGDINGDIKRGLFTAGDVAMDINGPWELAAYKEALGDNLGLAPVPTVLGKTAITFSGIKTYDVSSFTKYPNAAKLYADFATNKDAQLLLSELIGSIPTNLEALETDQIKNDPFISGFAEQAKNSEPMPSIPEMNNVWGAANAAFADIWNKDVDAKATLENAVKQITDLNNGVAAE